MSSESAMFTSFPRNNKAPLKWASQESLRCFVDRYTVGCCSGCYKWTARMQFTLDIRFWYLLTQEEVVGTLIKTCNDFIFILLASMHDAYYYCVGDTQNVHFIQIWTVAHWVSTQQRNRFAKERVCMVAMMTYTPAMYDWRLARQ